MKLKYSGIFLKHKDTHLKHMKKKQWVTWKSLGMKISHEGSEV